MSMKNATRAEFDSLVLRSGEARSSYSHTAALFVLFAWSNRCKGRGRAILERAAEHQNDAFNKARKRCDWCGCLCGGACDSLRVALERLGAIENIRTWRAVRAYWLFVLGSDIEDERKPATRRHSKPLEAK